MFLDPRQQEPHGAYGMRESCCFDSHSLSSLRSAELVFFLGAGALKPDPGLPLLSLLTFRRVCCMLSDNAPPRGLVSPFLAQRRALLSTYPPCVFVIFFSDKVLGAQFHHLPSDNSVLTGCCQIEMCHLQLISHLMWSYVKSSEMLTNFPQTGCTLCKIIRLKK